VYYAPGPIHVLIFLKEFMMWVWCYWPSLLLGFPYRAALYDSDTGELIPGSESRRAGTTEFERPPMPKKIKFYNKNSDRYRADHGKEGDDGYAVALNIKALKLKKLPRKKMLAGMRKILA
jgi:hypothetical protein